MATPLGPIDTRRQPELPVGTPYCSNCLYDLSASADATRCPECGKPIIEVLARVTASNLPGQFRTRRYTSPATVWGMPFVSIAFGPRLEAGERFGRARGFIALGDVATGVIALGGRSTGVFSAGGFSVGAFSLGGFSMGGLLSAGGCALAFPGAAAGGLGIGGFATGGMSVGVVAQGGMAVGAYAKGAFAIGFHVISGVRADPQAVAVFDALSFLVPVSGSIVLSAYVPIAIIAGLCVTLALLTFALGVFMKKEPAGSA
jgi:hypothetical protein